MLLVCPNCSVRYALSSIALGEEGRDVRCVKCDHKWYVEREEGVPSEEVENIEESPPDIEEDSPAKAEEENEESEEESAAEEAVGAPLDEDPIPEGVKPRHESAQEEENAPSKEEVLRPQAGLQAKLTGYVAALMIFALLIAGGFVFKQQIVSVWLPAATIYELAGMPVALKGERLVVESLSAKLQKDVDGQNFLLLEGRVINLTNQVQDVPKLLARLRSTNGEEGDSWHIDTPLEKLEPGESFTFKSDYPAVPRGVGSVNLTFIPAVSL